MGGACGCLALKIMSDGNLPPMLIVLIAILAAFSGGILMGLIYSFLTVTLKANQNVTGLAMTTFGVGTTKFIMSGMATQAMKYLYALDYFRFPFAESTTSLKYCGIMMYLAIAIALVASYVLTRTRVGLHLRAVGENPATADAVGINVTGYKYVATCIGSGVAALGGLFYIMDYSGSYEAYKSIEALGWLSVALVIFAMWKPWLSILGSALFGALYIAGFFIPNLVTGLSMGATPLLKMLPYVVTIVVFVITSIRKKRENQPPASLGLPYFREDR
jgi:simple sugar transport system permease protein